MSPFDDAKAVAVYAEGPPRMVPGFFDLQRMTRLLLAERATVDARVLVLGAGGGLELEAFARAEERWTFDGVDPSAAMLALATERLGPLSSRVRLHQGTIEAAPDEPFDAACCLLTMHFVPLAERLPTLQQIRRRLRPGAPFVMAHFAFPQDDRALWLSRNAAFLASAGVDREKAEASSAALGERLTILEPEHEESLLREAGFVGVGMFYAALAFRGWVAHAS